MNKRSWNNEQRAAEKTLLKYRPNISQCDYGTLLGMVNEGRIHEMYKGLIKILIRNQKEVAENDGRDRVQETAAKVARTAAQE